MEPEADVTAAPDRSRYELRLDGELVGIADYEDRDGDRLFTHTEISPSVGGRGLGSTLVEFALDDTEAAGKRIVPVCSFVAVLARERAAR